MLRISLDIETLGVNPGCSVLEIGATTGSEDFHVFVDPASYGHIEPDTLEWWKEVEAASPEARSLTTAKEQGVPLAEALTLLSDWYTSIRSLDYEAGMEVWCLGPRLDIGCLEHAYRHFNMTPPWTHREIRDLRTARELFDYHPPRENDDHSALRDAKAQHKVLEEILRQKASMKYMKRALSYYSQSALDGP